MPYRYVEEENDQQPANRKYKFVEEEKQPESFYQKIKETSKHESVFPDFSLPRLGMQTQIGSSELISLIPELGIEGVLRLADKLGAPNLTEKFEGGREFGTTLATAPYRLFGIQTEPQSALENIARGLPGTLGLAQGAFETLPAISRNVISPLAQKLSPLIERFLPQSMKTRASQFEKSLVGEPTATTLQKPSEEIASALSEPSKRPPIEQGRITVGGKPLKVTIPSEARLELPSTIEDSAQHQARQKIGKTISSRRFENLETGGKTQTQAIQQRSEELRNDIKKSYNKSKELAKNVNDPFLGLFQKLQEQRSSITVNDTIPFESLNPAQQLVVKQIDNVLQHITPEGRGVNVDTMLGLSDAISSRIGYEDLYGGTKSILRKVVHDINESAIDAIKTAGKDPTPVIEADQKFANWADKFNNDYIQPYLQKKVRNPEKLFEVSLSDPAAYRALKDAIGDVSEGNQILEATTRNLVEERMKPYFKDPNKIGSLEYTDELKNLESLIGQEKVNLLDKELKNLKRTKIPERRKTIELPTPLEKMIAKKVNIKSSDVKRKFSTIDGIREMKEDLKSVPNGEKLFENQMRAKLQTELKKGKVRAKPTFGDMFEVLNKEENYDFLSEMFGEKNASKIMDVLEEMNKKEASKKNLHKFLSGVTDKFVLSELIKIFVL